MGAPRPPPFLPPKRLCFLQGFPCLPCRLPTPISCLFSCPFLLFLRLKEKCSLLPCASPSPHATPCPALAPSPSSAPSSQEWLCLLGCPAASPPATLLLLLEGTTAKPCSSRGDGATSQLRRSMGWSWGGREPPSHTHTCCKANLYLPLRLSRWRNVRTHDKAANRAAGGSPPGPAERQELGLSVSPGPAPRPSLQGAHKWDLPQAGFTPPAPG